MHVNRLDIRRSHRNFAAITRACTRDYTANDARRINGIICPHFTGIFVFSYQKIRKNIVTRRDSVGPFAAVTYVEVHYYVCTSRTVRTDVD